MGQRRQQDTGLQAIESEPLQFRATPLEGRQTMSDALSLWHQMMTQLNSRLPDGEGPDLIYCSPSMARGMAHKLGVKLKSRHQLPRRLRDKVLTE